MITGDALYRYATKFFKRNDKFPTFKQVARRFRCRYDDIEEACDDYHGIGYLGVAIGIQVNGAIGQFESRGQYEVEAYT